MNILAYLLKTVLISGLLLGYYWLFLRNRFFHGFNRYFLLGIPFLSFLLPALHLNLPEFWNHTASGLPIRLLGVGQGTLEEAVTIYGNQSARWGLSLQFLLAISWLLISVFLFIRFYKTIRFLYLLRKNKAFLKLQEAIIYFVSEKGTPFSFFNSIFWGKKPELTSEPGKHMLRHELFHVKQKHSIDIIILEVFFILNWFNPFLRFISVELKATHEYGADAFAAAETDNYTYANLLLTNVAGSPIPFTNPFFKYQIKRRITMITKSNKKRKGLAGRIMVLPLIAILMSFFSFKISQHPVLSSNQLLGKGFAPMNSAPIDTLSIEEWNKWKSQDDKIIWMHYNRNTNGDTIKTKSGYERIITRDMLHFIESENAPGSDAVRQPIFKKVEIEASFPGGQDAWSQYLLKNIHYPQDAMKKKIQGIVVVEFIVQKDGKLANIHSILGTNALKSEAERVIAGSGKWMPATQNGLIVNSYHKQPVYFVLEKKSEMAPCI